MCAAVGLAAIDGDLPVRALRSVNRHHRVALVQQLHYVNINWLSACGEITLQGRGGNSRQNDNSVLSGNVFAVPAMDLRVTAETRQ